MLNKEQVKSTRNVEYDNCVTLWAEVFERAVKDLKDPEQWGGARAWFFSDRQYLGSFVYLCELFGYDKDSLRRLLSARLNTRPKSKRCTNQFRRVE